MRISTDVLFEPQKLRFGAHRGLRTQAPENSIPAYILAGEHGFEWAWVAVARQSKDGTWYAMHDETLDRTTNGTGKIAEVTDEYLKTVYTVKGKNADKYTPEELHIPTLEEVIAVCRRYGMAICFRMGSLPFDLDTPEHRASWDSFIDLMKKHRLENSLFSGCSAQIRILKQLTDNWHGQKMSEGGETLEKTYALVDEFAANGWTNMSVLAGYKVTNADTVAYAHRHGYRYVCCNMPSPITKEMLQNMCAWGVDICQNPEGAAADFDY